MMIRPVITLTRPGLANFQLKQKQKTAHSNFNSRATSILYVLLHVFLHSQQSFMCPLLKPNLNSSVMVTAVICMCHFLLFVQWVWIEQRQFLIFLWTCRTDGDSTGCNQIHWIWKQSSLLMPFLLCRIKIYCNYCVCIQKFILLCYELLFVSDAKPQLAGRVLKLIKRRNSRTSIENNYREFTKL